MQTIVVDQKGRILLPKQIRERLKTSNGDRLMIERSTEEEVTFKVLKPTKKKDKLLELLDHPFHVSEAKIKEVDLEKVEDEMWMP